MVEWYSAMHLYWWPMPFGSNRRWYPLASQVRGVAKRPPAGPSSEAGRVGLADRLTPPPRGGPQAGWNWARTGVQPGSKNSNNSNNSAKLPPKNFHFVGGKRFWTPNWRLPPISDAALPISSHLCTYKSGTSVAVQPPSNSWTGIKTRGQVEGGPGLR